MDPLIMQGLRIAIAACLIAFASWLSGPDRNPWLAGFVIALPLTSMLALAFSAAEHKDPEAAIAFAKSILFAVPLSLLFFVPFLLADKLKLGFWWLYAGGVGLLFVGWLIHARIVQPMLTNGETAQAEAPVTNAESGND
ncbi:MAG: hypothetical protein Alpg2KO_05990 [Alphaproteobacteria bacterium]